MRRFERTFSFACGLAVSVFVVGLVTCGEARAQTPPAGYAPATPPATAPAPGAQPPQQYYPPQPGQPGQAPQQYYPPQAGQPGQAPQQYYPPQPGQPGQAPQQYYPPQPGQPGQAPQQYYPQQPGQPPPQQYYPQGQPPQQYYPQGYPPGYYPNYAPPGYYPGPQAAPPAYYGPGQTYTTGAGIGRRPNVKAIISGSMSLGIAWSLSTIVSVVVIDSNNGDGKGTEALFLPGLGPFIAIGTTGVFDSGKPSDQQGLGTLLILDGVVQVFGAITMGMGIAGQQDANLLGSSPWVPEMKVGLGSAQATWQF